MNENQHNKKDKYLENSSNFLSSINITLTNQFFPPDYAATGQLLDQLTKLLVKKNIFFLVLTGNSNYAKSNKKNLCSNEKDINIVRLKNNYLKSRKIKGRIINGLIYATKVFIKLLKKDNRGDLIIFTSEPPFLVFYINLIYLFFKVPYIYLIYDLYPDTLINLNLLNKNNLIVKIWHIFNKSCLHNSKNIILLSELMKEKCLINYGSELNNKIKVIPSWSDINKIKPLDKEKNKFLYEQKLHSKFVILYSGNQGRMHDFDSILFAAKYLKKNTEILFIFIGDGPLNKNIKEFKRLNNLQNIRILPYQPFARLPETLTAADIAIVSTSKNATSLVAPSKLYGHLASGTPIALISSKNSYIRNMIELNNCGKWFNNGDYKSLSNWIIKLKENNSLRNKMSVSARTLSEKISDPNLITKEYFNVILKSIN